ncbi:hypothetical protein HBB16_16140 [Pseudonocardia sp. MCCB 268]|nr:hypothetical protein [Pseudonocardia cytotoxica]
MIARTCLGRSSRSCRCCARPFDTLAVRVYCWSRRTSGGRAARPDRAGRGRARAAAGASAPAPP